MKSRFILLTGIFFISVVFLFGCSFASDKAAGVYTGTVECDDVDVSNEISGIVTKVFVEEGDYIKKGDKILQFDVEALKIESKQASAALKIATAKFNQLKSGATDEEIKKVKALVEQSKAIVNGKESEYQYRTENYNKMKKLYEESAVSKQSLEDAKLLMDSTRSALDSAKEQLESVQYQLEMILKGARPEEIEMVEGEVERAKAALEMIQYKISKEYVLSPVDGTIKTLYCDEGELVPAYSSIAKIVDLNSLWVKIFVPEKELYKVSLGQEVEISADFLGGKKIMGKVFYISPEAEFTPKNVESKENKQEMVFAVKIRIIENMKELKPGMLVDINLGGE